MLSHFFWLESVSPLIVDQQTYKTAPYIMIDETYISKRTAILIDILGFKEKVLQTPLDNWRSEL